MPIRNLVVVSSEDTASCNIKNYLLELGDWQEGESFENSTSYILDETIMVTIEQIHLNYDNIDRKVETSMGITPALVIYASRHRSESRLKTLTLHPLGNFSEAKFGGEPGKLVPSAPQKMTQALRILTKHGSELPHKISYEATHHGPLLSTPTFFIEIGSDEQAWEEPEPAVAIARTILDTITEPVDETDKVAIGVGGGHYVPRFTELALTHHIAFGHMVPKYASELELDIFRKALDATPGVNCVYFHKKYLRKARYREIKEWCESEGGIDVVDSKKLESR
jgi:D-aminoacyl-tRNA deacylase